MWAQAALDQSAVPVLWLSETGHILYANNTAASFFNKLNHYLTETNIQELLQDEYTNDAWQIQWEHVKQSKYFRRTISTPQYATYYAEMHFISTKDVDFIELRLLYKDLFFSNHQLNGEEINPYAVIFNNSFHFMARLTPDGRIVEVNHAGLALLEAKINDIIGKKLHELQCFSDQEDAKVLLQEGMQKVIQQHFVRFELSMCTNVSGTHIVDFTIKTVNTSTDVVSFLLAEARDITAYKRLQNKLIKSINQYRRLAQDIPNAGILQYNNAMQFTLAEGQALRKVGFDHMQLEGKKINEVFTGEELEKLHPYFVAAIKGGNATLEHTFKGIDFLMMFSPVYDEKKQIEGGLALIFDISKPKATENQLNRKLQELENLNQKLSKEVNIRREIEKNLKDYSEELKMKNNELEQFAYVASHDLQEPLRMISSFTQLLSQKYQDHLDADANEFIRYTLEGTIRMQRLINDLLIYSRVGGKGAEFEEIPLSEIVELAKQNIQLTIEETDTEIIYENLATVRGDKGQLVQLMQNLFSNAIKFRKINVVPKIEISSIDKDEFWEVIVKDNGIGFDITHQARIFNIFQRLHSQGEYSGTGIGLAICKKIAERHGGEIWAVSERDKGSAFHFTIRKSK
ncbi:MAG: ATP-binding protein [Bacteroidia bacterium]